MNGPINGQRPAARPAIVPVRVQRCENCAFVNPPASPEETGTCRFNPPTAVLIMIGTDQKGHPVMRPAGIYPPVGPADYCYRHKPRMLGVRQSANDEVTGQVST